MAKDTTGGKRGSTSFSALSGVDDHRALIDESKKIWGQDIFKQRGFVRTSNSWEINNKLRELEDGTDVSKVDLNSRHGWFDNNKVVQNMDTLTSKVIPGNQNRLLTRFVGKSWAEKALGVKDLEDLTRLDFKGVEFKEKGFTCTSTIETENVFRDRPIKFEIEAPKGTRAFIADNLEESEATLPRNSEFRIKNITKSNNGFVIRTRIIKTPNNARGFAKGSIDRD